MTSLPKRLLSSGARRGWARTGLAVLVLAVALVLLVRPANVARAEPPSTPNLRARVAQLEADLAGLADALAAETAAREAAEAALQAALAAETADRIAEDDALYVEACAYTDGEIETALGGLDPAELAALSADLDVVEETLAPFSTVADGAGGYDVYVTAANIHIENGLGSTNTTNGLGNLMVGYNEVRPNFPPPDRTGSHNLVVGPEHEYLSYGGLIAGYRNYVSGPYSSLSGGWNDAGGWCSSVSGGYVNYASGDCSTVSGGAYNIAWGDYSTVSGGCYRSVVDTHDWCAGGLWQND